MTDTVQIVDLDEVATWPEAFRALVELAAAGAEEDRLFCGTDEAAALETLKGRRLRAYHCTRLTPREVDSVRSSGLRVLSADFTEERLANAVDDGHLTEDEAMFYGQTTLPRASNRAGKVWLFTDRASLASAIDIGYLVEVWGGEGINMALVSHSPEMERLERVGTPSTVVAAIDPQIHYAYAHPGVLTAAVRHLL